MTLRMNVRILLAATGVWLALPSMARAQTGFVETFADDPVAAGRFHVHDGDAARFAYVTDNHMLVAHYNTLQPTTRLVRALCRPLTELDTFAYTVAFRINSAGFLADPRRNAQIAFGLMNSATTGVDRVYGANGQGAFDLVSFDYYPNVTSFGGPSAGPTLINKNTGGNFSLAINFEFGPETQLNDLGEGPLPKDTWLTADVRYDGPARRATLRVLQGTTALPINMKGKGAKVGGTDNDTTTIVSTLTGAGFTVDSFGLLLWQDTSATFATVIADVDFQSIIMTSLAADFDHNGTVGSADLDHLRTCFSGPAIPWSAPSCGDADLDCDDDIDQTDFALLQTQITGSP
jgi:hypothetical protein